MKNITLSAEENLIEAARQQARRRRTTLNAEFRDWLRRYASHDGRRRLLSYQRLMEEMAGVSSGGRFSREEMNER